MEKTETLIHPSADVLSSELVSMDAMIRAALARKLAESFDRLREAVMSGNAAMAELAATRMDAISMLLSTHDAH